jgi:hypothetical protein
MSNDGINNKYVYDAENRYVKLAVPGWANNSATISARTINRRSGRRSGERTSGSRWRVAHICSRRYGLLDDFVAVVAPSIHTAQQLSISGPQPFKFKVVKIYRKQQITISSEIWFGTRFPALFSSL